MMHPPTRPIPATTPGTVPAWEPTVATTDPVNETPISHSDYNLQPLLVQSLGHYVIAAGEDERFFVH